MGSPPLGVRGTLFPKRGVSATEFLLAVNLAVAAVLLVLWGREYSANVHRWALDAWQTVRAHRAYGWFLPTLFLHLDAGHLASNMIALLLGAGAVEFLSGSVWTLTAYVVTGLAGAWVSYAGHAAPPLSVGSSGAVFGLLGCAASFIVRRRRMFNYAKRWKVWRVYIPLFILLFVPALARADLHAHVGGFACGLVLGLWLPPHERIAILGRIDSLSDELPEEL
jgi:rhomboid protease GluP